MNNSGLLTDIEAPIRILGVGNVLTRDDGMGPFAIAHLIAGYDFPEDVALLDIGTPGMDFTPYIAHARSVIVLDAVKGKGSPGSIEVWRNEELLKAPPVARTNPHEPGLREALMATELTDSSPQEIILIGVVPEVVENGTFLSDVVRDSVPGVIAQVLAELDRLDCPAVPRAHPGEPEIWWE